MLYDSIYWTTCLNLLVKSRIKSPSCWRIVCKELVFLFGFTEQNYDTNAAHSSLNEFIDLRESLWNKANVGSRKLVGNTLHNRWSLLSFSIIT